MEGKVIVPRVLFYILLLFFFHSQLYSFPDNRITRITPKISAERIEIEISGQHPLKYNSFTLQDPFRVVVDFPYTVFIPVKQRILVNTPPVNQIKIGQFNRTTTRAVIILTEKSSYDVFSSSDKKTLAIVFKISDRGAESVKKKFEEPSIKYSVNAIKFDKSTKNIFIESDGKIRYRLKEQDTPPQFIFEIPNMKLNLSYNQILLKEDNLEKISAEEEKNKVFVKIYLKKYQNYDVALSEDGKKIIFTLKDTEEKVEKKELEEQALEEIKEAVTLKDIAVSKTEDKIKISLDFEPSISEVNYKITELSYPARIKIDLSGVILSVPRSVYNIEEPPFKKITATSTSLEKKEAKILVELTKQVKYDVSLSEDNKKLSIEAERLKEEIVEEKKPPVAEKIEKKQEKTFITHIPSITRITTLSWERVKNNMEITIVADGMLRYKIKEYDRPPKLVMEFFNTKVQVAKPVISLKRGGIEQIRVEQVQTKPLNISKIAIDLSKKTKYNVSPSPDYKKIKLSLEIPPELLTKSIKEEKVPPQKEKKPVKIAKKPVIPALPQIPLPPVSRNINVDFKDADVVDVLRILGEMSGMNVFVAEDVKSYKYYITVSLRNIPVEQALDMVINSVKSGPDVLKYRIVDNTVVVSFSQEILDRIGGGMLIGDLSVQTFALKSYTREEFSSILSKIVPEVTIINTPDRPSDIITVVGPKSSLLKVENLIKSLKPTPEILVETFNLGNLKPDDVEEALKKAVPEATIFAKKASPSSFSVSGSATTIEKVKKFMEKLNLAPEVSYKTISTRETKPEEIEKILKEALPSVKIVKSVIAGDTMSVTLSGSSEDLAKAEEIITNLEGGTGGQNLAKSVEVFKLKNLQTIAQLQERGVNIPGIINQLVPGVNTSDISIDERTNSIIVRATPSNLEKVKKAIELIDVRIPQVSIEAMVVDLSAGGGRAFSSAIVEMVGGEKTSLSISPGAGGATIPVRFSVLKKDFETVLKGLISQQKAKVLASPKVSTLSGYPATITLQDKVPYQQQQPGGPTTTGGGGTVVQEAITVWEYENVGITLEILPTVNEENKIITLKVKPTIQTITAYVTGQRPAVNERTVETLMRIEDGQSIAIGGLVNSTEREEMSKIPIISELPIVGKLFSSKSRVSSDSEIVIIITAKILPY